VNKLIAGAMLIVGLVIGVGITQIGLMNVKSTSVMQVTVKVIYDGSWIGTINSNGVSQGVQGTGEFEMVLDRPENIVYWSISVSAQKLDSSNEMITIKLMGDGGIMLMDRRTNSPNGVVAFSVKYR
jgi:hypothetical protein